MTTARPRSKTIQAIANQRPFVAQSGLLPAQSRGGIDIAGLLRMILPVMVIGMMARVLFGVQQKVEVGELPQSAQETGQESPLVD